MMNIKLLVMAACTTAILASCVDPAEEKDLSNSGQEITARKPNETNSQEAARSEAENKTTNCDQDPSHFLVVFHFEYFEPQSH